MVSRRILGFALAWASVTGCATDQGAPELDDAELARIAVDEVSDLRDEVEATDRQLLDQAEDAIARARRLHDCKLSGLVAGLWVEMDDGTQEFDGRWIDLSNRHLNGVTYGRGYNHQFEGLIEGRLLEGYQAGEYANGEFAARWEAVRYGYPGDPSYPGDPIVVDPIEPDPTDPDIGADPQDGEVVPGNDGDTPTTDTTLLPPDSYHSGFVIGDYRTFDPFGRGYFFGAWAECEPAVIPMPEPLPEPCDETHDVDEADEDGAASDEAN